MATDYILRLVQKRLHGPGVPITQEEFIRAQEQLNDKLRYL